MIYKTLHGKLKIVQLESHSKKGRDEYRYSEKVSSSYSTKKGLCIVSKVHNIKLFAPCGTLKVQREQ
jgi:hypothetical protein